MQLSIEDLAKLAKVTVRSLRYYDEIDLLKPSIRMASGRRYYGMPQAIDLCSIIFYKKLGFRLAKIKRLLSQPNMDQSAALKYKKIFLQKEIKRLQELIKIIDKTEFYYQGEPSTPEDIAKQFDLLHKQSGESKLQYEREFGRWEDNPDAIKAMSIEEQQKHLQDKMKKVDLKKYAERTNACFKQICAAIDQHLKEDSKEVQDLMREYYEILGMMHSMSKMQWLRIALSVSEDMDTYLVWSKVHPKLPGFLNRAMQIYSEKLTN